MPWTSLGDGGVVWCGSYRILQYLETSGQIVPTNIWREYSIKHFRHIMH